MPVDFLLQPPGLPGEADNRAGTTWPTLGLMVAALRRGSPYVITSVAHAARSDAVPQTLRDLNAQGLSAAPLATRLTLADDQPGYILLSPAGAPTAAGRPLPALLVITDCGVPMALLLPAVQRVRDAPSRLPSRLRVIVGMGSFAGATGTTADARHKEWILLEQT